MSNQNTLTHQGFVRRFAEFTLNYRYFVFLITIAIVVVSALGIPKIKVTPDYRVMFSEDYPQLIAFDAMQNIFGQRDNIMIALAPDDGEIFTAKTLDAIEWLTQGAWSTPSNKRVDSLTNFQDTYATGDDLLVKPLVENAINLSADEINEVKILALNEPLLVNRIVSQNAKVAAVNITMHLPHAGSHEQQEAVEYVRALMQQTEQRYPWIKTYLTGEIMMGQSMMEAGEIDAKSLFPIMLAVILIASYLFLRSVWAVFSITLIIILSVLCAMGMSGHLQIEQSLMTGTGPIVILTLAVADSVHILVTMFQEMRLGAERREAIIESLEVNMQPIFLTSLTTGIGFLSLNSAESPPFHALGNIVSMGIVFAFLFSVTTLPALLSLLPVKVGKAQDQTNPFINKIADIAIRRRSELSIAFILTLIFTAHGLTLNQFNDLFQEMFGPQLKFRQDTDFIREHMTGVMLVHHAIESGQPEGIFEPDYLTQLDELTQWYKAQPGVMHVESYSDLMRRLNRTMHGGDPFYYQPPRDAELAAQYHLLYELSLPYGLDVNNLVNIDQSTTRVTVTMGNVESLEIAKLDTRALAYAKQQFPALKVVEGVGPSVMMGHAGQRNGEAMIAGGLFALVTISLIIMIALRNIKLGILSLIPNLAPAIIGFGIWGMAVGYLGIAAAPAVVVAFGIVVDNTIHFLSKYLRARRVKEYSVTQAIHYSYHRVGMALGVTSTILSMGFVVLAFSSIKPNQFLGEMTALSLVISLAITFFILPPLLILLEKDSDRAA